VIGGPHDTNVPTRSIETGSKLENKEWLDKADDLGLNHGYFIKDEK